MVVISGGKSTTVIRGELKGSFVQSHPILAGLDKVLGWTTMLGLVAAEFLSVAIAILDFVNNPLAIGVFTIAACFSSFTITSLTFMLWHTFCYYDSRMRKIMTTPSKVAPDGFMRIGILPIPAAASVGILLWVTAVLVSPSIQGGSVLQPSTAGGVLAWTDGMTCRAASVESADYLTSWTARLERSSPLGSALSASMRSHWTLQSSTDALNEDEGSCFNAPHHFSQAHVMDTTTGKDLPGITNLANPKGDKEGRLCMYQCVTWKSINLQTLLTSSGTITVGAGIVVVFTEYFSGKLGIPTITENTSPQQLEQLINMIGPDSWSRRLTKPFQASMFGCALPILVIGLYLKLHVVSRIDADGFGTVDFYTVYCLLFSICIVTLMRMWHFFECRPQLYTKKLWHAGLDDFIVTNPRLEAWNKIFGKGEIVKCHDIGDHLCLVNVDLYQWMHLRAAERTELLVNYCRRPNQDGTEANTKLLNLGPAKVTLTHQVELGSAGTCTCEKIVELPARTELIVVGWKNKTFVKVRVCIAGKMETIVIDKHECIESDSNWEKDIFDTLPDSLEDPDVESGGSGNQVQPSVSGLRQKLLTIEEKLTALEQASSLPK